MTTDRTIANTQRPGTVDVTDLVARVNDELDASFDVEQSHVPQLGGLAEAIRYSLLAPGKRIRPVLVLAAAESCVPPTHTEPVAPRDQARVASAIELIHTYSLVHDDLPGMDNDDLRRGLPTNHKQFDEATAILVGDALQAEAFRTVTAVTTAPAQMRLDIIAVLSLAAGWTGMVGGQHLDMRGIHSATDMAAIRDLHNRKTAALISASVEIGAIIGRASSGEQALFASFGREVGWLFQLVDDMLDATGDVAVLGKPIGSDERQGKITSISTHGGIDGLQHAVDQQLDICIEIADQLPNRGGRLPAIARFVHARNH